jgi:MOSC domain-containing protein YiiM
MAEVIALHRAAEHHAPMESLEQVAVIENYGLEGDRGTREGRKRQVLLVPNEVLQALDLQPGQVRENLTTQGIDLMALEVGSRIRVGEVLLEMVEACDPCKRMEEIRPGLEAAMGGKRGMIARVLEGGQVRKGDPIEVLAGP